MRFVEPARMPQGKRRKKRRNTKVASPGPRRNFFATPAARMINAEPRTRKATHRSLKAARVHGTSFGVMIDAIVRARPQARELVRQMTKNMDQALDKRAEDTLDEMAVIVLAKKKTEDDFGETQAVPVFDTKSRISAARVLLDFTKEKPKQITHNVEMTAEEWLDSLPDE